MPDSEYNIIQSRRTVVYIVANIVKLCLIALLAAGCIKESSNVPEKTHGEAKPSNNNVIESTNSDGAKIFKDKKLADYPSATIEEAFGRYAFLAKKEWKVQSSPRGKNVYIDFSGWFDSKTIDSSAKADGVKERGLEVKFVIYPDGSFRAAMVSKLEMKADGKRYAYPDADLNGVLTKIYSNQEIKF